VEEFHNTGYVVKMERITPNFAVNYFLSVVKMLQAITRVNGEVEKYCNGSLGSFAVFSHSREAGGVERYTFGQYVRARRLENGRDERVGVFTIIRQPN
jgi:hypothetical protein